MKTVLTALAVLAAGASVALAHPAPKTKAKSGPVPQVLIENAPVMLYENGVQIPFIVNEDKTLFWVEMMPELEKSIAGPATWTWDEKEFCMIIDNHPDVCFTLEKEMTPGEYYDSTVRFLDPETKKEKGSKSFRFLIIRTDG